MSGESDRSGDKNKTVIGGAIPVFGNEAFPQPIPGGPAPLLGSQPFRQQYSTYQPPKPGGAEPSYGPFGGGFGSEAQLDSSGLDAWGGGSATPNAALTPGGFNSLKSDMNTWNSLGAGPNPSPAGRSAFPASPSLFPDAAQPQQQEYVPAPQKIGLQAALEARGLNAGAIRNPIIAASADLLVLFGRLRTQMVAMDALPLMTHVTREIEAFEANLQKAGVDSHQVQVAKYMLCATADDIVQNIPGTDRNLWIQYSMVARFFRVRTSGVGFFQEAQKALAAPAQHADLLELALLCLSLGFEGQYRTAPNGGANLQRIRTTIYESLRRLTQRPDEDISPRWEPVPLGAKRRFGRAPLWVIGSVIGAIMLGGYLTFATMISAEGSDLAGALIGAHPEGQVALLRTAAFVPAIADPTPSPATSTQIERMSTALSTALADGSLEIGTRGDYIFIRINNSSLFDSGRAEVKPEFSNLAIRLSGALDAEKGPLLVLGFTDNVPLKGTGRFKNNIELSVARAESVKKLLGHALSDANRINVEGRGEEMPIADNKTSEGRAKNRRVEILIRREETL
jgi:type VI secretion system protein ImpK